MKKINTIIKEKHDLENEIKKINSEHKTILDEMITSKSNTENKYNEIIKENEKLQEKMKQLTIIQDNLEQQLNAVNIKYKDTKKTLTEKEKELSDLKEVSQALIQKEKTQLEQSVIVDPNKCKIIADKQYKKLTWYLIFEKNPNKKIEKTKEIDEEDDYENYRWVTGLIVKKDQLGKFNKYDTDEQKITELQEAIFRLTKKLEEKEESFNKLDYQNKKLIKELHNKTAGNGLLNPLTKGSSGNLKNNNKSIDIGSGGFKNILAELNSSNKREKQLQNQVIKLNDKLKLKDSSNILNMNTNITLNNDNKIIEENENKINDIESQKKVDEFLNNNAGEPDDFDEVKLIQKQMKMLKQELKETRIKLEQLSDQVKELLKNVKCDNKNKPQFVQICRILNLSPQTTNRIITNNNKKAIKF